MAVTSEFNDSDALGEGAQQGELPVAVRVPASPAFPVLAGVIRLLLGRVHHPPGMKRHALAERVRVVEFASDSHAENPGRRTPALS